MSSTPRSDAIHDQINASYEGHAADIITAMDFARGLERELNAKPDEIGAALKLCHRLRNGAARMTKQQFRNCLKRSIGATADYADNVRVHFQNNPAAFLAHRTPQTQSIELLRVLLEITRQPGDDGTPTTTTAQP